MRWYVIVRSYKQTLEFKAAPRNPGCRGNGGDEEMEKIIAEMEKFCEGMEKFGYTGFKAARSDPAGD